MVKLRMAIAFLLVIVGISSAACSAGNPCSDFCSSNPDSSKQSSQYQYHEDTCNIKWRNCAVTTSGGGAMVKPPPYFLLTMRNFPNGQIPSGQVPVDFYTMSMQKNTFAPSSPMKYTLHGLWPGSQHGDQAKNQPYGCLNGEEFDETVMTRFSKLFEAYWPTDPKYHNTPTCFVLSEWMKHGTCAVIPGADGSAFRISQDLYYRTAIIIANEANFNSKLSGLLTGQDVNIETDCVTCAYFAATKWSGTTVSSVPRMPSYCVDKCIPCDDSGCSALQLDSTVQLDPSNAPQPSSVGGSEGSAESFHTTTTSFVAKSVGGQNGLIGGVWRSFGAEQPGSGKFEFAQEFIGGKFISTTDSPYPQVCDRVVFHDNVELGKDTPSRIELHECGANKHSEYCLALRLPDVGGLEVAFFACNHSGSPRPQDFHAAMNTPKCGNFLMFRCKNSDSTTQCHFSAVNASNVGAKKVETSGQDNKSSHPAGYDQSVPGAPSNLLGSWRSLQVSENYSPGLARWNFTSNGLASLEWTNYPSRGVQRFETAHSADGNLVFLVDKQSGRVKACSFEFRRNEVFPYATLSCKNSDSAIEKWAIGRCNGCDGNCYYSCNAENDNCGHGPCEPHVGGPESAFPKAASWRRPNWCKPGEASCWPTREDIAELEKKLDPQAARTALKWTSYPQPQPAPVPMHSNKNLPLYGLGANDPQGLKALYFYDSIDEMDKPCFTGSNPDAWNNVSAMCKAAVRQNEYRNWDPYIVVFPLNERHVAHALKFAAHHRLCIAVSGTGHEYLSRNSCPTGGILIRTILLKEKTFLPTWEEDPSVSPAGAFRFGAGLTFSELHEFSGRFNRLVVSGWCATVGMVGYHLGGGHGPFGPSHGLGVDNVLSIEVMQIDYDSRGKMVLRKRIASRKHNPQLFWAMRGGGGSVWGVVLSMTLRAHPIPNGGLSRVFMVQDGTFCPGSNAPFGYEWLRKMWKDFASWNLLLNEKVSTQPGFFIDTSNYTSGDLCSVTWKFKFEYIYAGGQSEPDYVRFRDGLKSVLGGAPNNVTETNFKTAFEYLLSMDPAQFSLAVNNPIAHPSDQQTGSQNSVFVSRLAMSTSFPSIMMDVLDICVDTLLRPDVTSPDPTGHRCGFHYLYTSITGNIGSTQPDDTSVSSGLRTSLMLWNVRTLTTEQMERTLHRAFHQSYFSESPYVLHRWTEHYWERGVYQQLLAVKRAHDPGNHFWCHHCIGDNPEDAYGETKDTHRVEQQTLTMLVIGVLTLALAAAMHYYAEKKTPATPRQRRN